jgi:regulation of enolase protein 1 (concanavalin A-like superfamily)
MNWLHTSIRNRAIGSSYRQFKKLVLTVALSFMGLVFGQRAAHAQTLPAFVGAEGFGAYTSGGRGGTVYHVTNLNDSGTGSFRDAVSGSNRIIVFDVGGIISLKSVVSVGKNLTIAGQTAPGEGITTYGGSNIPGNDEYGGGRISFTDSNRTIVRGMRFRHGAYADAQQSDAVTISRGSDMIFDHLTVTWGTDETFSINGGVSNVTIQNCIIGQGLEPHSAGGLVESVNGGGGISLLRNLFIDNNTRNPKANGTNQFINNVVYNWGATGGDAYIMGDTTADSYANVINSYFINGPHTASSKDAFTRGTATFHIYASGNYQDTNKNGALDGRLLTQADYPHVDWLTTPYAFPTITTLSAQQAYNYVVQNVGAPIRDRADQYMIGELTSLGTKGVNIRHEFDAPMTNLFLISNSSRPAGFDSDNDGMPDSWEHDHALNKTSDDHNGNYDGTGYTNIEKYINSLLDGAYPNATLPAPWSKSDIGSTGVVGTAGASNGTFRLHGSGADIWSTADAFHFIYQPLSGDGAIVARMKSQTNTSDNAKAGVMIRESLNANSTYALAMIKPSASVEFQRRKTTGGTTAWTGSGTQAIPYWLKLTRSGSTFTAAKSIDGENWTTIGSDTITMGSTVYFGLAVSSHNNAALSTARFDNVTVTRIAPSAGITVTPTTGLISTESGGKATFTVTLNSQPTADVVIGLSSSDTSEGTIDKSTLTFTSTNWNTAQTVTITGVNDAAADGDVAYSIVTAAALSSDADYKDKDAADVAVTNIDNDVPSITVTPTTGLTTTEANGKATFTVVLNSAPSANVIIGLSSSKEAEGTVAPSSLIFSPADWSTPQTVTVTGVDDALDDNDITYSIVTAAATSNDGNYNGRNAADVAVTNINDDTAGISVTPTTGLVTTESGGTATFTVRLDSRPTANVDIALSSSKTGEGTVLPASLTFTSANWSTPQTVTVMGVNDNVNDSDTAYTIATAAATSVDANYNGTDAADVSVVNTDNDTAGITVTGANLTTTEAGGSATFTVQLNTQPTAGVTIGLSSSDTSEGTVAPLSLTFTSANWSTPQTVTVTGVDDAEADGNINYKIITAAGASADANYNKLDAADVAVSNTDNEIVGITVTPTTGLVTTEAGGTATFNIKLTSRPAANVTLGVSSDTLNEGMVAPATLTFTPDNWSAAQLVTITGADDLVADGDRIYNIVTAPAESDDAAYEGFDAADVAVTNTDNDNLGITVTPTNGLTTTEAGGKATFTIKLGSAPTADVTIDLSSSDPGEGMPDKDSLTFTSANWSTAQTVTVTGADDAKADGNVAYTIVTAPATSNDTAYNSVNASDVGISNSDDDTVGITVTPGSDVTATAAPPAVLTATAVAALTTTEAGGKANFTVRLNSQPTADVTIRLSSSDTSEGTVEPESLTLTADNWSTPQIVTVTGVDDALDDGNIEYTVATAAAVSTDAGYNKLNAVDMAVTNTDDESAGITVTPTTGLTTTEAGGTATFSVKLASQPTANVTIGLSSNDTAEGTVDKSTLTFTPVNWSTAQTVTVTGQDDTADDGNVAYYIVTAKAVSDDASYKNADAADVAVTNTDNDDPVPPTPLPVAGILMTPTTGLTTTEAGGTATFTIKLASPPASDVSLGLSTDDPTEGIVNKSTLTFTPANWNTAQTVTVTGVNDDAADGNVAYKIVTAPATSDDTAYKGLNGADVSVTNSDNDTVGITVTPTSGLVTTEAGGTATFSVKLNTAPTANVAIALSSSNTAEGTPDKSTLTFTPANWSAAQIVTVVGKNDNVVDGSVVYNIVTAAALSRDAAYNGLDAANVAVTNTDNDVAPPPPSGDRIAPAIAIMQPPAFQMNVSALAAVQGVASDASGVRQVVFTLERSGPVSSSGRTANPGSTQFWSGSGWVTQPTSLPATFDGRAWRNRGALPGGQNLPTGQYRIEATATDNAGNESSTVQTLYVYAWLWGRAAPLDASKSTTGSIASNRITTVMTSAKTWGDSDIGAVGVRGMARFDKDVLVVAGSGDLVAPHGSVPDAFHYLYQSHSGDGVAVARVTDIGKTNPFARAGIMFRAGAAPDSAYAGVFATPGATKDGARRLFFQLRQQNGAVAESEVAYYNSLPVWIKLARAGDKFSGFYSKDGKTWVAISESRTVVLPREVLVGVAVSSADNGILNQSTFDSVSLSP